MIFNVTLGTANFSAATLISVSVLGKTGNELRHPHCRVSGPCQGFTVDGSRKTKKVDEVDQVRPNKREKTTITVKRYITLPA